MQFYIIRMFSNYFPRKWIFRGYGFTVLELIVVIAVIGILSSVLLLFFGSQENLAQLQGDAYTLSQNIREVELMSMGAQTLSCGASATRIFGVHFEKNAGLWLDTYILFGDCNYNYQRDGGDIDIRRVSLKPGVKIGSVIAPGSSSVLDIVFTPPDPMVYLNNASSSAQAEIILLSKKNGVSQKKVIVNTAGRIESQ